MEDQILPSSNSEESAIVSTIAARQDRQKKQILDELKKVPIVEIACKKTGIGRASYYRWRQNDPSFREESDIALKDGVQLITELAESKLISQIQEENLGAIIFWLKSRNPAYREKLEVSAKKAEEEDLTKDQESIVNVAMKMAQNYLSNPIENGNTIQQQPDARRDSEQNQQGSEDQKPIS